MPSATPIYEVGSVVLGYVGDTVSWRRDAVGHTDKRYDSTMIVINLAARTDESVHTPAASVSIGGRANLLALRESIDEALKEHTSVESV